VVASGLGFPVFLTAPPGDAGRLFIVDKAGYVRIVKGGALLPTPFLDIHALVTTDTEQGLLGLAFDPLYAVNGRFFVDYTDLDGNTRVVRFQASANPDMADPGAADTVITVNQPASNHNGGMVAFGPDGYLYVGLGDGGGANDQFGTGQTKNDLLASILRLDVNGPKGYMIPVDNPFSPPDRRELWDYGLRNPWRFSFDRGTGDLYIADVGQSAREEVDVQPAASTGGENYGWDIFEGTLCHEPEPPATTCPSPPTGFTFPVLEYDHSQGCSITGGYVYRGCAMPDLAGTYFYSDICSAFVRTFKGVSGGVAQNLDDRTTDVAPGGGLSIGGVSSFGEDARGELYIVDYGGGSDGQGEVYKLVPGS
jgi:glucose/arabinose dehydrogenase